MTQQSNNEAFGRKLHTLLEAQPRDTKAEVAFDRASVALIIVGLLTGSLLTMKDMAPHTRTLEWISGIIFGLISLEYVVRVWVSGFDPDDRYPMGVERIRFALKPINFIDVLCVGLGVYGIVTNQHGIMLMGFGIRLFRVFAFSQADDIIVSTLRDAWPFFKSALQIWGVAIVFSTIMIYLCEKDAQPDKYSDVFQGFYWSVVTFTSTGYGDLSPVTPWGKVFTCCYMLSTAALFLSLPAGIFTSRFMEEAQKRQQKALEKIREDEATRS